MSESLTKISVREIIKWIIFHHIKHILEKSDSTLICKTNNKQKQKTTCVHVFINPYIILTKGL